MRARERVCMNKSRRDEGTRFCSATSLSLNEAPRRCELHGLHGLSSRWSLAISSTSAQLFSHACLCLTFTSNGTKPILNKPKEREWKGKKKQWPLLNSLR
ncbi:hypothetical protein K0M31_011489 [Melipona bicolor]|uniref:Uncharacterized protein n=1 Tax=Melipona bicolor TaxID=60889 RepID=A0AA40G9N2_9HYME|nr:hypothetical protein K0M31_011489 [Melipona bicolor]